MIIPSNELSEWFSDFPQCYEYLLKGYQESVPFMSHNMVADVRIFNNEHMVNMGFEENPAYFMGYEAKKKERLLILSCLYVFPKYRSRGYAKHLISSAQNRVRDNGVIQVAVEKGKIKILSDFYENLGFKSTYTARADDIGKKYVDFFWSGRNIELIDTPKGTIIKSSGVGNG